jgi:predicted permease
MVTSVRMDVTMQTWLDDLRADVLYGLRWCRRTPGFTLAAVLSLALGIGANTAIFSLIDTVLLRALPVRNPEQLVVLSITNGKDDTAYGFSYGFYQRIRTHDAVSGRQTGLSELLASSPRRFNIDIDGRVEPMIAGQFVSGTYYQMLGVPFALGRPILPEDDDQPGAHPVAVLSDTFWESRFARDPGVIGRTIRLNGYPFTIIGVSAPEFFGVRVGQRPDVSIPVTMQLQAMPDQNTSMLTGENDNQPWLELMARVKPGVAAAQAEAELRAMYAQYFVDDIVPRAGPKAQWMRDWYLSLEPGSHGLSELRRQFSRPLFVLMAIVALVLLIACANIANLLLARAAARQREIAVRVSLGAGRGRLVRQLLTESLLLAVLGAACGVLFAQWGSRALAAFLVLQPGQHLDVGIDLRVLSFTALVALGTGLVFGIVPAIGAARVDAQTALKDAANRATTSRGGLWLGKLLVVSQMSLSLWLMLGAGLFVQTLRNLEHVDLGFEREHLLSLRLQPRGSNQKNQNRERLDRLYLDLLDRIRAVPGVRSASLSGATPLVNESVIEPPIRVDGYVPHPGENLRIRMLQIYPDYFATLGVSIVAGRELAPGDNDLNRPPVAIVNETLARRFYGSPQGALDRDLVLAAGLPNTFRIIGVARDIRDQGPRVEVEPTSYSTYAHTPTGRGQLTLLVRASGDTRPVATAVRQYARAIDPEMPLPDVQTVAERLDASLRQEQLIAWLSGFFGGLALLLACIGLYGVMAYAVARRTGEFGIRLALGARRADVAWLVLRDILIVLVTGIAIGLPIAWATVRFIAHMLFGLVPTDPATVLTATLLLAAVALLSGWAPMRQAARVDPLTALRHE